MCPTNNNGELYDIQARDIPDNGQFIVPDGVTAIGKGAFLNCWTLLVVNIPEGVTVIRADAFSGCRNLSRVNMPDSVTAIESGAFVGCRSLRTVKIPDAVTAIAHYTFAGCDSLSAVRLPDSLTVIHFSAFERCRSLSSLRMPENLTSIASAAFAGCINLRHVHIPNSVTTIAYGAFAGCSRLSSVRIPDSLTAIEPAVFERCAHLSAIIIDSDDSNKLASIRKMLPAALQGLIVSHAMYAEILKAQQEALHAMLAEPTLGSVPGLRSRLSSDPQTIIASYEENSVYAQIQQKLLAHPLPIDETALTTYKNDLRNIVEKEISVHKKNLCITRLAHYLTIAKETIGKPHPAASAKTEAQLPNKNMQNLQRLKIVEGIIEQLKQDQKISLSDAQQELLQGGMVSKILEEHDIDWGLHPQDPENNRPAPKF